jgi:hypothetical protein
MFEVASTENRQKSTTDELQSLFQPVHGHHLLITTRLVDFASSLVLGTGANAETVTKQSPTVQKYDRPLLTDCKILSMPLGPSVVLTKSAIAIAPMKDDILASSPCDRQSVIRKTSASI